MTEQPSIIKPLFNYSYKHEGVILDQKYNYQGNILAVCNSQGDILFYSANGEEQMRDLIYFHDRKRNNQPKYAVLKIAWSMPIFSFFAAATINREIQLYVHSKQAITLACEVRLEYVPQTLAFCPIENQVILAVGLSNGTIILFDEELRQISSIQAHEESVSCLAWDHKILSYYKNKWITSNFAQFRKYAEEDQMPQLISGSSDSFIKIWKCQQNRLVQMHRLKAHQKAVRDVQWRHTYLIEVERYIISCSEDSWVKIWRVKRVKEKIVSLELKEAKNFGGPVYRANFNFLGNILAISYCNENQQKVETIIMRQKGGALMGEQLKLQS